ncbi:MAG: hypothetical protein ACKPA7_10095 [Sphaerospermopsis kisseleviana]
MILIRNVTMLRHLKNFNELVLYASISCGLSFFVRLNPSFFYAVLLLRLCVLGYAFYVIADIENNRVFGICLGTSVLVGLIGGNWDWLELQSKYNQSDLISTALLIAIIPIIGFILWQQWGGKK